MPLAPGTQLGPYEILELIGSGGMGEVYRARDPRLNRDVAIKVSAGQFTERFEREARAVAALNHPNICTLFDVGPNYLVMELVEGVTLSDRVKEGAIPLEESLNVIRQIAAALEEAHDKGIVHRDLKPGNVKITPGGAVKVLDFGLAKHTGPAREGGMSENSPTISMAATQAGVILGTAAYMSPEQAKGKPVDKRADIWAFGVVLYEMVTGRQPFHREDVSETLAAVIMKDPEFEPVPVELRKLLKRCLEKDPKKRLRDITGMELLLETPTEPVGQAILSSAKRSMFGPVIAYAAAAVFFLALAALAFIHFRETPPPAAVVRFQIPAPEKSSFSGNVWVSPDGRRIGFVAPDATGRALIWIRTLDSLQLRSLTATDDPTNNLLFWSPDSRFIGFFSRGKLKKVEASGSPPQPVCDLPGEPRGGAWNSDGVIVFATTTGTYRVSAAGGAPSRLTGIDASRGETQHSGPVFLPDQQHFFYNRRSTKPENSGIYLGSIDAKPEEAVRLVLLADNDPVYAPSSDPKSGYVLFLREGQLMAQTFDLGKLALTGEAVFVAEGVGNFFTRGYFSASRTGVLVFRSGGVGGNRQYTWFDRQGKNLGAALEPGLYGDLSLSPDGARVVGDRVGSGQQDLWILDFAIGVNTQFTFDPAQDNDPIWSPDGSRIAFDSTREGNRNLYQKVSSGAGSDELLFKSPEDKRPKDWSRDGKFLLYNVNNPKTGSDLFALPMLGAATGEKKPIPVVATEASEDQGQFSPDSHWVAYRSSAGGRNEIYVRPFPPAESGGQWKVSNNGGIQPRWSRDGKELFYIATDGKLTSVAVSTSGGTFKSGTPQPLFDSQVYGGAAATGAMRWDLTPDGKKFLIITQAMETSFSPMTVILNWPALLKR